MNFLSKSLFFIGLCSFAMNMNPMSSSVHSTLLLETTISIVNGSWCITSPACGRQTFSYDQMATIIDSMPEKYRAAVLYDGNMQEAAQFICDNRITPQTISIQPESSLTYAQLQVRDRMHRLAEQYSDRRMTPVINKAPGEIRNLQITGNITELEKRKSDLWKNRNFWNKNRIDAEIAMIDAALNAPITKELRTIREGTLQQAIATFDKIQNRYPWYDHIVTHTTQAQAEIDYIKSVGFNELAAARELMIGRSDTHQWRAEHKPIVLVYANSASSSSSSAAQQQTERIAQTTDMTTNAPFLEIYGPHHPLRDRFFEIYNEKSSNYPIAPGVEQQIMFDVYQQMIQEGFFNDKILLQESPQLISAWIEGLTHNIVHPVEFIENTGQLAIDVARFACDAVVYHATRSEIDKEKDVVNFFKNASLEIQKIDLSKIDHQDVARTIGRVMGDLATTKIIVTAVQGASVVTNMTKMRDRATAFASRTIERFNPKATDLTKNEYTFTKTLMNEHYYDLVKRGLNKGMLDRPYMRSQLLIREIIATEKGIPDLYLKNSLNFRVPGRFGKKQGVWELVVDPVTKIVSHFLFNSNS